MVVKSSLFLYNKIKIKVNDEDFHRKQVSPND